MPSQHRSALTAPYYVYHVTFYSHDIPRLPGARPLAGFPRSDRDIWVWKRSSRDLLLKIEPDARWVKHEARKCPRCGGWRLGIQAQMMREREMCARINGEKVPPAEMGANRRVPSCASLRE